VYHPVGAGVLTTAAQTGSLVMPQSHTLGRPRGVSGADRGDDVEGVWPGDLDVASPPADETYWPSSGMYRSSSKVIVRPSRRSSVV